MLHLDWSPQGNGGSQGHLVVISSLVSMRQAYSNKEEKNVHLLYLMSCPAASKHPAASSQRRRVSSSVMHSGIWE